MQILWRKRLLYTDFLSSLELGYSTIVDHPLNRAEPDRAERHGELSDQAGLQR